MSIEKQIQTVKTICVNANVMDHHILKYIVELLRQKYEKKCDKNEGYILSIDEVMDLQNLIGKDSCTIYFTAKLLMTVIKPEKGMKVSFTPSMIISKGVFGKLSKYDTISFLIPDTHLKEWNFQDGIFVNVNDKNKKITKEKPIDIIIIDIKFNQTKYNCVCSLC